MAIPGTTLEITGRPFSATSTSAKGVERNDDLPIEAIIPPFTLQGGVFKTLKFGFLFAGYIHIGEWKGSSHIDMSIRDSMQDAYEAAGCEDPPSSPPREPQESNLYAPPAQDDRPDYGSWHKLSWMIQEHPSETALIAVMSALSIVAPGLMARGVGSAPTGATAGYGFALGVSSQQEERINHRFSR